MIAIIGSILIIGASIATWKYPRLTSAILWSLVSTICVTAALLLVLPGAFSTKALWVALSVPIFWAVFQFLCYYIDSPRRIVVTQFGMCVISGVIILFSTSQL